MSREIENLFNSIMLDQIPESWQYPNGFLSNKTLSSWIYELCERIDFFGKWILNGKPKVFWFSGFFFP